MKINQWIRVDQVINISTDFDEEEWYSSKVTEIQNRSFVVSAPQRQGVFLRLKKEQKVRLSIPAGSGLYLSTCLVLDVRDGKEYFVEIEIPQELVHMERRRFARVHTRMEVFYSEIRERGNDFIFNKSYSLDISSGGMQLELYRSCPQETLLHLKFTLPVGGKEETFFLTGRIVRALPSGSTGKGQAGIEFIDISSAEQEDISKFVSNQLASEGAENSASKTRTPEEKSA